MGKILINQVRCFAYHGVLPEEAKTGTEFVTDIALTLDLTKPGLSDDLNDTVNYAAIAEIVYQQMAIRSELIEHVAQRILTAIRAKFPQVEACEITLTKKNAPIDGQVGSVAVQMAF